MKGEVVYQDILPSFGIFLVNSLDEVVDAFKILLFPNLVVVFLDINQLFFATVLAIQHLRV
jgi:hypothetical protein